jgi:hypothetical protein
MSVFHKLLQNGGADAMGLLNNQSGGAAQAIAIGFNMIFPLLFFVITKIVHDNLDDERAEKDESFSDSDSDSDSDDDDDGFDKRDYVIWGLFTVKSNLLMMFICWILGFFVTSLWFSDFNRVLGSPGNIGAWWWKLVFGIMILTHAWSIVFGGIRSTAAAYFYDTLWDDRDNMKDTCKSFGCGWAPHGSSTVERGIDYRND